MAVIARASRLRQWDWLSPTSIDNTGTQNVSASLSAWLADVGQPGDRFQLRPGSYWIPQGVRIGKAMELDLNGAWLTTGTVLGPEDPNLAASQVAYPPLWDDWSGVDVASWPGHRNALRIPVSDVRLHSSLAGARIIGAARKVVYRGGFTTVPEGCEFNSPYEGQHGIRVGHKSGASFTSISNVDLDLTNISVEFPSGDGVYLMGNTNDVTIHGAQAGPAVVDANFVGVGGDPNLGAVGGLPDGIDVGGGGGGTYDLWIPGATGYPGIHHTARQGIAMTFGGTALTIKDLSLWRIGRSAIDIELATGVSLDGLIIARVEFGHMYLGCINNPYNGPAHNVVIEDCHSYKQIAIHCADGGTTVRRNNWTIRGNRARFRSDAGAGAPASALHVDGLTIVDNYALVQNAGQGIDVGDSTGVTISPAEDIQFPPTTLQVTTPAKAGLAAGTGRASRVATS